MLHPPRSQESPPALGMLSSDSDDSPVSPAPDSQTSSGRQRSGAFELKFLVPESVADQLLERARAFLIADPHARPTGYRDSYRITSMYFDTGELDVFHRRDGYRGRKLRLRRYGDEATIYLERKAKSKGLVRKRRTAIGQSELERIAAPLGELTWDGHWFHRRLVEQALRPTVQVAYDRIARVEMLPTGPIRLTVDRNLCCCAASGMALPPLVAGERLLLGQNILELKFREAMPAFFKALMREFQLVPARVSKYRLSVLATGRNSVSPPREQADVRMA